MNLRKGTIEETPHLTFEEKLYDYPLEIYQGKVLLH